ncbi:MAG: CRISPR-associated endonuclease Cas2 [Microcoleus sp. CSU_2_2]|nr:CRISPR-associated endonuclease Cas2 [Microcoleus sp. SU_5_3]NJS11274.1 CRISPR-associated endonuclease Cas2 [Microcoleus sp. CSU_2_2]
MLKGYGTWVQYSTFECVLSSSKFAELQKIDPSILSPLAGETN